MDCAELTDPGRDPSKQINEDACALVSTPLGVLGIVCDGMGGHSGGREASTAGVRSVVERLASGVGSARDALNEAVEAAATSVYAVGADAPPELRPGSTCVAVLLHEGGAEIAHVGDSRAYLLRGNTISRLTRDHSMVQQLVDAGMLTPEAAAEHPESNKITRALGIAPTVEVELRQAPLRLLPGDMVLLCSDGLTDLVSDDEIAMITRTNLELGPEHLAQVMVNIANSRGGHDNITVVVMVVVEVPRSATDTVLLEGEAGGPGGPTLVDAPPKPNATWVGDDPPPKPSPTLLDEPHTERTTLPGDAPREVRAGFLQEPSPDTPRVTNKAKTLVWGASALAGVILSGIGIWAIARAVRAPTDEVPPPPPAPPPPAVSIAPTVKAPPLPPTTTLSVPAPSASAPPKDLDAGLDAD